MTAVVDAGRSDGSDAADNATVGSRMLIGMVRLYQAARTGRPTGCRFVPSCSEYAIEAVERHGALRGSGLAARRLSRCTPWGGHGPDPVPERRPA